MKKSLVILMTWLAVQQSNAQRVSINATGEAPDNSAILDVKSTTTGMLIPRMTTAQRQAIANPATGLLVFDITTNTFWFKNATAWTQLVAGGSSNTWAVNGNNIYKTNAGNVGIGTTTPQSPLTVQTATDSFGIAQTDNTITLATKIGNSTPEDAGTTAVPGAWIGTRTNHPLNIFTNNGNRQVSFTPNYVTQFRGTDPSLEFYDGAAYSGTIRSNTKNLTINAATENPFTPADPSAGNLLLQYGDFFRNGNVAIGDLSTDFKLTVGDTKLSNNQTLLLKLKGRNPVMTFEEGSFRYGYITAKSQTPAAPFVKGLLIGAEAGYPIQFSTNNYNLSMVIANNGNVGIGTNNPTYKLSVNGNIRSKEVIVESGWADYVFDKSYNLKPLSEVERFINANGHLPNIPSASEIEQNGLHLGDVQKKMMEKIEELTLYIIELKKEMEQLKNTN